VHLQVSSLEQSLAFYTGVLGLAVLTRDERAAIRGVYGRSTSLVELHERSDTIAIVPSSRLGLYHFAILLPDRAALGQFIGHLGRIGARAGASDHAVSEALYLRDPDGLGSRCMPTAHEARGSTLVAKS